MGGPLVCAVTRDSRKTWSRSHADALQSSPADSRAQSIGQPGDERAGEETAARAAMGSSLEALAFDALDATLSIEDLLSDTFLFGEGGGCADVLPPVVAQRDAADAARPSAAPPESASSASGASSASSPSRYWSRDEQTRFEQALALYETDYNAIARHIGTRTPAQVRSHARKYYDKMVRDYSAKRGKRVSASRRVAKRKGGRSRPATQRSPPAASAWPPPPLASRPAGGGRAAVHMGALALTPSPRGPAPTAAPTAEDSGSSGLSDGGCYDWCDMVLASAMLVTPTRTEDAAAACAGRCAPTPFAGMAVQCGDGAQSIHCRCACRCGQAQARAEEPVAEVEGAGWEQIPFEFQM